MKRYTYWRGRFFARDPETGLIVAENEILESGINMVMELWAGDTSESFGSLRIEDASQNAIDTQSLSISYGIDSTNPPIGMAESTALFPSSNVTSAIEFVVLVGSNGRDIARAPLSLASGNAYEIKREDYLGEAESVT